MAAKKIITLIITAIISCILWITYSKALTILCLLLVAIACSGTIYESIFIKKSNKYNDDRDIYD